MSSVPKCFRASRAGRGKRSCEVSGAETGLQIGAANIFVQESGVETVACTDGIDRNNLSRRGYESLTPLLRESSFSAKFHDQQRNQFRKFPDRFFQILPACCFTGLALVRQKYIDMASAISVRVEAGNLKLRSRHAASPRGRSMSRAGADRNSCFRF